MNVGQYFSSAAAATILCSAIGVRQLFLGGSRGLTWYGLSGWTEVGYRPRVFLVVIVPTRTANRRSNKKTYEKAHRRCSALWLVFGNSARIKMFKIREGVREVG